MCALAVRPMNARPKRSCHSCDGIGYRWVTTVSEDYRFWTTCWWCNGTGHEPPLKMDITA